MDMGILYLNGALLFTFLAILSAPILIMGSNILKQRERWRTQAGSNDGKIPSWFVLILAELRTEWGGFLWLIIGIFGSAAAFAFFKLSSNYWLSVPTTAFLGASYFGYTTIYDAIVARSKAQKAGELPGSWARNPTLHREIGLLIIVIGIGVITWEITPFVDKIVPALTMIVQVVGVGGVLLLIGIYYYGLANNAEKQEEKRKSTPPVQETRVWKAGEDDGSW